MDPCMDHYMDPIWVLYGSYMDPIWILYGSYMDPYMDFYMDPIWILIWILYGYYMEPLRWPCVDRCVDRALTVRWPLATSRWPLPYRGTASKTSIGVPFRNLIRDSCKFEFATLGMKYDRSPKKCALAAAAFTRSLKCRARDVCCKVFLLARSCYKGSGYRGSCCRGSCYRGSCHRDAY